MGYRRRDGRRGLRVATGENRVTFKVVHRNSHIRHAAVSVRTVPSGVTSVGNCAMTKGRRISLRRRNPPKEGDEGDLAG